MTRGKSALVCIASVVTAILTLTSCGSGAVNADSLRFAATEFPANLFPNIVAGTGTSTAQVMEQVLPRAFIVQPDFTLSPDINLLTEDPRTTLKTTPKQQVTYKINPKAQWSDGTPITADDFIFTWQVNDPTNPDYHPGGAQASAACQSIATGYDTIGRVDSADNGRTVIVTFKKSFADWPGLFAPLLPAHYFKSNTPAETCQKFNKGWPTSKLPPLSAGPYKVTNIDQTAQSITLSRNDKYWGPPAKLSQILYQVTDNSAISLRQALENQEFDATYPQPQLDLVREFQGLNDIHSQLTFGLSFEHIDFNMANPLLQDVRVRQAIALALDRADIVHRTVAQFDGGAKVLNNRIFVNNQPGYQDNGAGYESHDLARARELMREAGYERGKNGFLVKDGKKFSVNLVTTQGNDLREQTVDLIKRQLKDLGVDVHTVFRDASVLFGSGSTSGSLSSGDFDLALYAWSSSPSLSGYKPIYSCPPGPHNRAQNAGLGCDPQVDTLINKAITTLDQKKIFALWNQVDKLLWKDMFTIPLYQKPTFLAYRSEFSGLQDNSSSESVFWNANEWQRRTSAE